MAQNIQRKPDCRTVYGAIGTAWFYVGLPRGKRFVGRALDIIGG